MRRRDFVAGFGATALWPLIARAQQSSKVFQIGFLSSYSAKGGEPLLACLQDGLRQFGWVQGKSIHFELRWAGGDAKLLPAMAAELAGRHPDLIIVSSTPGAQAAQRATRDIPVVFVAVSDPVANGIVASLARPGANVTGVSNLLPATTGKLLELLKAVCPSALRFAVLRDPNNPGKRLEVDELQVAGRAMGLAVEAVDVATPGDVEDAFSGMPGNGIEALITLVDGVTMTSRVRIAELAIKSRLPSEFQVRDFVDAGGLMSYGPNYCEHWRRAASYADRIMRGASPASLPVELPTKFELVINLKTAKALGLEIPPMLLGRADEVIE
jgi:putative tryptophan/tyrosine transport system substrate-binding protein